MSVNDTNTDEKRILAEAAVDLLNDFLQCDREAIEALIEHRVPCSEKLLDHPLAQCGADADGNNTVGMLGILNGLFGTVEHGPYKGWGLVGAVFFNTKLSHFKLIDADEELEQLANQVVANHPMLLSKEYVDSIPHYSPATPATAVEPLPDCKVTIGIGIDKAVDCCDECFFYTLHNAGEQECALMEPLDKVDEKGRKYFVGYQLENDTSNSVSVKCPLREKSIHIRLKDST